MRPELQVKQYVAVVRGRFGRFMVFATGSDRHYLFSQLDPAGCATGLQVPVRKADLRPEVTAALRHGWGNAGGGREWLSRATTGSASSPPSACTTKAAAETAGAPGAGRNSSRRHAARPRRGTQPAKWPPRTALHLRSRLGQRPP